MSKRHQASRRRAYGRRQHELHERDDARGRDQSVDLSEDAPAPLGMVLASPGRDRSAQPLAFRFAD